MNSVLRQLAISFGALMFIISLAIGLLSGVSPFTAMCRSFIVMCISSVIFALFSSFFVKVLYNFILEKMREQQRKKAEEAAAAAAASQSQSKEKIS